MTLTNRTVYGLWLLGLGLKMVGATGDVAWHFRYLRDDFALPHNINTVGTAIVFALLVFHTWTGRHVTARALRLMQLGMVLFLAAMPLDLLNHAIFGLDITIWSPTHMMLYLGTAVMIVGVIDGWLATSEPGPLRRWVAAGLWVMLLEDLLFPLQQTEYGVLSLQAIREGVNGGNAWADPELIECAATPSCSLTGTTDVAAFILPVPDWIYPAWIVPVSILVLLAARKVIGWRFTATLIAGAYVAFRFLSYGVLRALDFPPSVVPWHLVGAAVIIDLAVTFGVPALAGALGVTAWYFGAVHVATEYGRTLPAFDWWTLVLVVPAAVLVWSGVSAPRAAAGRLRTCAPQWARRTA